MYKTKKPTQKLKTGLRQLPNINDAVADFKCQTWNKRQRTKEVPDLSGSKGKAVAKMADKDVRRSKERNWKNMKESRNDTSQREQQRRMTRETKLGAPLSDANQIRS